VSQQPFPQGPYQPPQVQQPYPYPQQGYPYGSSAADPLAPAKRASILMFVLGGLSMIGGVCCGVMGAMLPQILAQQPEIQMPAEVTADMMQVGLVVAAGIVVLYGVAQVVLGFFVRGGGRAPAIVGLILTGLAVLGLLVMAVSVIVGPQKPAEKLIGAVCWIGLPLVL
jgi:hypothetical protein